MLIGNSVEQFQLTSIVSLFPSTKNTYNWVTLCILLSVICYKLFQVGIIAFIILVRSNKHHLKKPRVLLLPEKPLNFPPRCMVAMLIQAHGFSLALPRVVFVAPKFKGTKLGTFIHLHTDALSA